VWVEVESELVHPEWEEMTAKLLAQESQRHRVAVLISCYNEAATIAQVIAGFRTALPNAAIYVYDNNSTDATLEVARGR